MIVAQPPTPQVNIGLTVNDEPITTAETAKIPVSLEVDDLTAWYGSFRAIKNITMDIRSNKVTAVIGPSGCGKSTFIRCLNRMHEVTPRAHVEGKVLLDGEDIYSPNSDPVSVRRRI